MAQNAPSTPTAPPENPTETQQAPPASGASALAAKIAALKTGSVSALLTEPPATKSDNPVPNQAVQNKAAEQEPVNQDLTEDLHTTSKKNNPFTEEALAAAWQLFSESIKVEKPIISAMLLKHLPTRLTPKTIEVTYETQTEYGYLMQERTAILGFLFEKLQNHQIEITARQLVQEQRNTIYTNEEKFHYLAQLNPLVETLKSNLDLDFE